MGEDVNNAPRVHWVNDEDGSQTDMLPPRPGTLMEIVGVTTTSSEDGNGDVTIRYLEAH
jgi:hypothetical protein